MNTAICKTPLRSTERALSVEVEVITFSGLVLLTSERALSKAVAPLKGYGKREYALSIVVVLFAKLVAPVERERGNFQKWWFCLQKQWHQ